MLSLIINSTVTGNYSVSLTCTYRIRSFFGNVKCWELNFLLPHLLLYVSVNIIANFALCFWSVIYIVVTHHLRNHLAPPPFVASGPIMDKARTEIMRISSQKSLFKLTNNLMFYGDKLAYTNKNNIKKYKTFKIIKTQI